MFPPTVDRVSTNTSAAINRRLRRETDHRVRYYADRPEEIDARLDELDEEWDIERTLQANAAAVSLAGLTLGIARARCWLALPFAVSWFLLQHATQGWCPPLPVLRRLGVRTAGEIERERHALKALRGDYVDVDLVPDRAPAERARRALRAADML
ncbi:MAG: hypothetical protein AB7O45_16765 [Alphaproteobacteria bacterium]